MENVIEFIKVTNLINKIIQFRVTNDLEGDAPK